MSGLFWLCVQGWDCGLDSGPKSAGRLLPGVGILSRRTEGRNFLFSGINLLSASSQAVPIPCWASASLLEVTPSRISFFGGGSRKTCHIFPQAVTRKFSLVLDGSLYRELLLKSLNSSFSECWGWGNLCGWLLEWDGECLCGAAWPFARAGLPSTFCCLSSVAAVGLK